ncbi:MAG: 6-phosphogluconolactonase [Verrucomicrobia bacterium]|nr:MAG: 6-phosphogluconolactonase [Verrucomicrobiota bacterium]
MKVSGRVGGCDLKTFASDDALAECAARDWLQAALAARTAGREFCTALSGGRIATKFYAQIVAQAGAGKADLSHAHFFWADERCLPPHDVESNFRLARELLFEPLAISDAQIHRIRGEDEPDSAAREAESEICRIAPLNGDGQPVLDLVLLGMGEDGHVASLFPDEPAEVSASPAVYRAVKNSPKPPPQRVTLGYAAIAAAREVWVLVAGSAKREVLRNSLLGALKTPLARVVRQGGGNRVYADFVVN